MTLEFLKKIGNSIDSVSSTRMTRIEDKMITIRKAEDRGHGNYGWLETNYTFSFAKYYNPEFMNFGPLRVINDDVIHPGKGFDTHPHDNMEIITYIVSGNLRHGDSMGNQQELKDHGVQRMSAGTGIFHNEFNGSDTDKLHLLQIWIIPDKKGYEPRYEDRYFERETKLNQLRLIASPDGADGSFDIHQDTYLFASILEDNHSVSYAPKEGRSLWLQVVDGNLELNGQKLKKGDGAAIRDEEITISGDGEFLLFDVVE